MRTKLNLKHRLNGVNIAALAKASGMSKGSIYHFIAGDAITDDNEISMIRSLIELSDRICVVAFDLQREMQDKQQRGC